MSTHLCLAAAIFVLRMGPPRTARHSDAPPTPCQCPRLQMHWPRVGVDRLVSFCFALSTWRLAVCFHPLLTSSRLSPGCLMSIQLATVLATQMHRQPPSGFWPAILSQLELPAMHPLCSLSLHLTYTLRLPLFPPLSEFRSSRYSPRSRHKPLVHIWDHQWQEAETRRRVFSEEGRPTLDSTLDSASRANMACANGRGKAKPQRTDSSKNGIGASASEKQKTVQPSIRCPSLPFVHCQLCPGRHHEHAIMGFPSVLRQSGCNDSGW